MVEVTLPQLFLSHGLSLKRIRFKTGNTDRTYTLSLQYRLNQRQSSPRQAMIPARFVIGKGLIKKQLLTFSDLPEIDDKLWMSGPYRSRVYGLFPLAADIPSIVFNIVKGRPISQVRYASIHPYLFIRNIRFR